MIISEGSEAIHPNRYEPEEQLGNNPSWLISCIFLSSFNDTTIITNPRTKSRRMVKQGSTRVLLKIRWRNYGNDSATTLYHHPIGKKRGRANAPSLAHQVTYYNQLQINLPLFLSYVASKVSHHIPEIPVPGKILCLLPSLPFETTYVEPVSPSSSLPRPSATRDDTVATGNSILCFPCRSAISSM